MAELNGATVVAVPMRRPFEAIAPASNDAVPNLVHVEVQPAVVLRHQLQPAERRGDESRDVLRVVPKKALEDIWEPSTGREPVA